MCKKFAIFREYMKEASSGRIPPSVNCLARKIPIGETEMPEEEIEEGPGLIHPNDESK
jgi:hypothetical protein